MSALSLFSQTTNIETSSGGSPMLVIAYLALIALVIVAFWRVFEKAGKPGWAAVIPIYNAYIILKIVNRPGWWLLLYLIPIVNLIVYIVVSVDLAKAFGKSTAFGIFGLWLFSFIGYLILAFGEAEYKKSAPASV